MDHTLETASNCPRNSSRSRINPATIYCLLVVFLPLLAVPAFIALGTTGFFLRHGASAWVQANDAIFDIRNTRCDVLVYGDSTAMTGIDPEVVERQTGFKTCNISVTNAVLAVTGNLTLDQYLRYNTRPKVLIVQLSPDDFQQENLVWRHTIYPEGLLELLRHGSPRESRELLLTHPREAVSFAGYTAGFMSYYAIKAALYRTTHLRFEEDTVRVRNGFFTPPTPPRTYCDVSAGLLRTHNTFPKALADSYRNHYANQGSVVLVDAAPIPSCDGNLSTYRQELNGVTNNVLKTLPIGFFNDDRHYTAAGARFVSTMLSEQVNEIASMNSVVGSRRAPYTTPVANLEPMHLRR